ncbi:MAG: 1-deoxy-D-xylulose-5-phosphate reductoisomerase [Gammaproteobacteria bacterium]
MSKPSAITILGATGSIGCNTLAVLSNHPEIRIHALTANDNSDLLLQQCLSHHPRFAVLSEVTGAADLGDRLKAQGCATEVLYGVDGLIHVAAAEEVDTVMAAIVGSAGLAPTLAAVEQGKKVLLANKESLVMSGDLFIAAARESSATIIPIDSEHNAMFQCLPVGTDTVTGNSMEQVEKLLLTASGGPFLETPLQQFANLTPEQACAHPNWNMGQKISVDSATLMNKGLEYIEACYLFGVDGSQLEVLIHPQSIVHSLVYFRDGSVLAQMGNPDMRIPIAAGLAWPQRLSSGAAMLDLVSQPALEFRQPDHKRFPCLQFGMQAARDRGTAPAALNAANEVAVAAFLREQVPFSVIPSIIEGVLTKTPCEAATSLAIILEVDKQARIYAKELIDKRFH